MILRATATLTMIHTVWVCGWAHVHGKGGTVRYNRSPGIECWSVSNGQTLARRLVANTMSAAMDVSPPREEEAPTSPVRPAAPPVGDMQVFLLETAPVRLQPATATSLQTTAGTPETLSIRGAWNSFINPDPPPPPKKCCYYSTDNDKFYRWWMYQCRQK